MRCWRALARSLAVTYAWDPYSGLPLLKCFCWQCTLPMGYRGHILSCFESTNVYFFLSVCEYADFKKHDRSLWIKRVMHFPLLTDKAHRSVMLGQMQQSHGTRVWLTSYGREARACWAGRLLDISCYWRQNIFCQSSEIAQRNLVISSLFLFIFIQLLS